ncbi:MAG: thiamine pyrophosphate-binding protein [Deltaproteobacteria bacterium]|nr:thiamine pyrophosphate-binding protein [Deltaproteobacteria bacterium]
MNGRRKREYGSDLIVDLLKAFDIEYAAVNPGSSFRGLHDSLVNYGGNRQPEVILCCHEEVAVSMAYGYARVKGRPMAAIVHDIVGLQHATMAIYNAWTCRTPVIVLGGTGPMDTVKRRSGIDWTHTALVQGDQVRHYVKWDDQPASIASIPESFIRAYRLATTEPMAPVYLCYDTEIQEKKIDGEIPFPDLRRHGPPLRIQAPEEGFENTIRWLLESRHPVLVADSVGRAEAAFDALVGLAELLAVPVLDQGGRLNFPSLHPLNFTGQEKEVLSRADLVVAVDVANLHGALGSLSSQAKVIHVHLNDLLVRSWSQDYDKLAEVDLPILADSQIFLPELLRRLREEKSALGGLKDAIDRRRGELSAMRSEWVRGLQEEARKKSNEKPIAALRLFSEMAQVLNDQDFVLTNHSARLQELRFLNCSRFNQFLGRRRFGGVGNSLPASLGAALALKGSGKLCVGIQPDGDFLFNPSTLWTAAHYEIPLLMVLFNNRSYYNDEEHQGVMAVHRGRPVENKTIGIRIEKPEVDFVQIARGYSVRAFGPVTEPNDLNRILKEAVSYVKEKAQPAVVDVVTQNR